MTDDTSPTPAMGARFDGLAAPHAAPSGFRPVIGRARARAPGRGEDRLKGAALVLVALWLVILFDPQWLMASFGVRVFLRTPLVLLACLVASLMFGALSGKEWTRRWTWYPPLLCFIAVAAVMVPFAIHRGFARSGVETLLLFWTLVTGTAVLVDSARRAEFLLLAYATQFLWWGLWGVATGMVSWGPVLSNQDGFGSWMVVGGGFCFFMALATDDKKLRRLLFFTMALCVVGVVSSFARGAFLGALVVFGLVFARSPHKGKMLGGAVVFALLVGGAAALLFGKEYWAEMQTILQGTQEETGEERWEIWKAAWGVFLQFPVFGTGSDNWSVFASTYYQPGMFEGTFGANPSMLWGKQTHNSYIQTLADHGIVGLLVLFWILVDFRRRNLDLRTPAASQRWAAIGGRLQLKSVALGLEAAMVAWMGAAALYAMSGTHWLYTLAGLNLLLHRLIVNPPPPPGQHRGRAPRANRVARGAGIRRAARALGGSGGSSPRLRRRG